MIETADQIKLLVRAELDRLTIVEKDFLLSYLVQPSIHYLNWEYGSEPVAYPAWLVADMGQDMGIFYSDHVDGFRDPWGAVCISAKNFADDASWFVSLEDAVIHSGRWHGDLPEGYEIR
jgi:hypothetical protein